MARAAGIVIDWQDFDELSHAVPLLARVYPNGAGDVNNFHAAGGIGYVVKELLGAGLLHGDILTVSGTMADYAAEPVLVNDELHWQAAPADSREIGRAHVSAPVTNAHLVCRLLLEKKKKTQQIGNIK